MTNSESEISHSNEFAVDKKTPAKIINLEELAQFQTIKRSELFGGKFIKFSSSTGTI